MPIAIILNNQSVGKNCPEIAAVRTGNVEQNVIGEAWVITPENITSVWRPECEIWEVAIQGTGTYAGTHKVKYLRQPSDTELNQLGVYTAGVTGSDYGGAKVVKDTGYVVGASPSINLSAENAAIRCDSGSSGTITAYKSKVHIDENTNIILHATDCTITAASGTVFAEDSKVTATGQTIVSAVNCTVEAHDSVTVKSTGSKLQVDGTTFVSPNACVVVAKGESIISCHDNKVKVTASEHVICIVNDIEQAHATGSMAESFAKQKFILSDNAIVVSKTLGDYVWTPTGKYYASAIKGAPQDLPKSTGRPRKQSRPEDEVAID